MTPAVVSTSWLAENLDTPGILIVDNGGSPEAYLRGHIPGAVNAPCHQYLKHFDARGERTQHVMTPAEFSRLCHALGLRRDHHVVVYDAKHGLYGARFRAVCRHFGLENVSVLDGGWNAWVAEGRPIATEPSVPTPGTDVVPGDTGLLVDREVLLAALQEPDVQVWDTRHLDEFEGFEDRDNARRGHVPGALHREWADCLDGEDTDGAVRRLLPAEDLERLLAAAGLDRDRPVITYCQSGIRAAFAQWVLEVLGCRDVRIYDASMGEWANREDTPLA